MNLSDKELDRLSREAANQHDPGDLVGPRSWDRLELRLDKELGKLGPSPLRGIRGIRRIPFYYAPAILLLVGVSYYLVRHGKGNTAKTEPSASPPLTAVPPLSPAPNHSDSSTKTLKNSPNSTRPDNERTVQYPTTAPGPASSPGSASIPVTVSQPLTGASSRASAPVTGTSSNAGAPGAGATVPSTNGSGINGPSPAPRSNGTAAITPRTPGSPSGSSALVPGSPGSPSGSSALVPGSPGSPSSVTPHTKVTTHTNTLPESAAAASGIANAAPHSLTGTASASSHIGRNKGRKDRSRYHTAGRQEYATAGQDYAAGQPRDQGAAGQPRDQGAAGQPRDPQQVASDPFRSPGSAPQKGLVSDLDTKRPVATPAREAALSLIQSPHSLARSGGVDDSALRAFAAKGASVATPIRLGKKKDASLHINRPLSIGLSLSPDFASVHSMAGDRPGSSIGLTMDYELANRLHIGTGLLLTRKNYAASPDNYHVPKDYYRINNPSAHDINLVKGSFYMLEVPLNLRYDFSVSGNTVFFISGGASSYLLTSEHSQYYFNYFGRQACLNFNPRSEAGSKNYLLASVDLSAGVETGISNSLSLLIAPYVKLPTRGMGFGQVQLTSVGINFALKFTPVLGRGRK